MVVELYATYRGVLLGEICEPDQWVEEVIIQFQCTPSLVLQRVFAADFSRAENMRSPTIYTGCLEMHYPRNVRTLVLLISPNTQHVQSPHRSSPKVASYASVGEVCSAFAYEPRIGTSPSVSQSKPKGNFGLLLVGIIFERHLQMMWLLSDSVGQQW